MNTDLSNYVKKYQMLSEDWYFNICKEIKNAPFERHRFKHYNGTLETTEEDPEFYSNLTGHLSVKTYNHIMDAYWKCLSEYIENHINLDWYRGWNGFTPPKFNRYSCNSEMKNHCDHIHDIFSGTIRGIPIISMIALLNDDFHGGNFIMFDNTDYMLKKGEVIIFPSIFLYPHRVEPITLGERL